MATSTNGAVRDRVPQDPDIAHCEQCEYLYLRYPGDQARHRRRHDIWQHGPKVLTAAGRLWPDSPIAVVDAWTSPTVLRRLAYDTACAVREENGWDFGKPPLTLTGHVPGARPAPVCPPCWRLSTSAD